MNAKDKKAEKAEKANEAPKYPSVTDGVMRGYQYTLTVKQTELAAVLVAKEFFDDVITDAITNCRGQQLTLYGNKEFKGKS